MRTEFQKTAEERVTSSRQFRSGTVNFFSKRSAEKILKIKWGDENLSFDANR